MAGCGRKSAYRKAVTEEVLSGFPEPDVAAGELVARVEAPRGGNIIEVTCGDGSLGLALLPQKFRKLVWIKRGDWVIVSGGSGKDIEVSEGREGAVRYIVQHVLYKEQVRYLKGRGLWPSLFDDYQNDKKNNGSASSYSNASSSDAGRVAKKDRGNDKCDVENMSTINDVACSTNDAERQRNGPAATASFAENNHSVSASEDNITKTPNAAVLSDALNNVSPPQPPTTANHSSEEDSLEGLLGTLMEQLKTDEGRSHFSALVEAKSTNVTGKSILGDMVALECRDSPTNRGTETEINYKLGGSMVRGEVHQEYESEAESDVDMSDVVGNTNHVRQALYLDDSSSDEDEGEGGASG